MKPPSRGMSLARRPAPTEAAPPAAALPPEPAPAPAMPTRQKGRVGKRALQAWVSPEVWRQISHLAIREDRSVQALLLDGLNLLFEKHGEHRIAHDGQDSKARGGEKG